MAECCVERQRLIERHNWRRSSGLAIRHSCYSLLAQPLAAGDLFAEVARREAIRSWQAASKEEIVCPHNPPDERRARAELLAELEGTQ